MILYLDTSSLLKHYKREAVASAIDTWMARADVTATADISLVEAAAVLQATPPWTGATRKGLQRTMEALKADWHDYVVISIDERLAADLAWRHRLVGFDSLHLAAALTASRLASPDSLAFASCNRVLSHAPRSEGLQTIDLEAASGRRRPAG
jgi:uncharacterized protein